jgi:chromosome segregation ATPase
MGLFNRQPKATTSDLEALREMVESLRNDLARRTNELSHLSGVANALDARLGILDGRLTAMTTEITHQLHELGTELEGLASSSQNSEALHAIEILRTSQTRIANEQARYEIAFRQDLAELAELIRRQRSL